MSRPIFSRGAPVEIGVSPVPPPRAQHPGPHELTPGQRLIDGRVFYSAAWLDQQAALVQTSGAEAPWRRRPGALPPVTDLSRRTGGGAAARVPGPGNLGWSRWSAC